MRQHLLGNGRWVHAPTTRHLPLGAAHGMMGPGDHFFACCGAAQVLLPATGFCADILQVCRRVAAAWCCLAAPHCRTCPPPGGVHVHVSFLHAFCTQDKAAPVLTSKRLWVCVLSRAPLRMPMVCHQLMTCVDSMLCHVVFARRPGSTAGSDTCKVGLADFEYQSCPFQDFDLVA